MKIKRLLLVLALLATVQTSNFGNSFANEDLFASSEGALSAKRKPITIRLNKGVNCFDIMVGAPENV